MLVLSNVEGADLVSVNSDTRCSILDNLMVGQATTLRIYVHSSSFVVIEKNKPNFPSYRRERRKR